MSKDNQLQEPGKGWRNDEIERAHVKDARQTQAEDKSPRTLEWLRSLHGTPDYEPRPCHRCKQPTTRRIAGAVVHLEGKNWGSYGIPECGPDTRCGKERELEQLKKWHPTLESLQARRLVAIGELEAELKEMAAWRLAESYAERYRQETAA